MIELIPIILLIALIILIIHIIRKHKEKKQTPTVRRVPYRLDTSNNSPTPEQRRKPTPINNRGATAITPSNNDYMNYRYCPDCHSRNKEGKQVIYKIGQKNFECTQCGCKFSI